MIPLAGLVDEVARRLAAAGIAAARSEARLLVAHATGLDRSQQLAHGERLVAAEPALALARRRAAREPMAYLLGRREFWSRDFAVGPGVLVPRPETETLVETALAAFPDPLAPLAILDLGTGSGCLLLTLLAHYANARGIGIDRSATALAWAATNRQRFGLGSRALLVQGSWLDSLRGPFDLVVANPPYVAPDEIRDPETAHEPAAALLAGPDGLAAYQALIGPSRAALRPGGLLAVEIGAGQATAVTSLAAAAGFHDIRVQADLAGRPRAVSGRATG